MKVRPAATRTFLLLAVAAGLLPAGRALAEVAVDRPGADGQAFVLLSGGGDNPTPWPTWGRVRLHADPRLLLNPDGDAVGDGPPGVALAPQNAAPHAVWSRSDGADREIVLSWWDGTAWTPPERVTDDTLDDLRPRIALGPDGTRHVVWHRDEWGEQRVWYRQPPALSGTVGTEPEPVTEAPDTGRLADVAVDGMGWVWVAYQKDPATAPGAAEGIFVARRESPFVWTRQRLGPTGLDPALPDLDRGVRIHASRGRLWVDWVDGDGVFAYRVWREATESWSQPVRLDYTRERLLAGQEEIAREMARARIRMLVLRPGR
ncbi:MAG: hypothetical protein D6718_01030 [Acidobacteria bacterium]|nr:MAG: hypothetical protein D6718_01030 [Acidobacteriota bacterium]